VALRYGLEEAIFLDSILFWYKENRANQRNFYDGRWWTFNSVSALAELLPWWTEKQLRRIIASCREQGALLAGNYSDDQRDRTMWYTPGDELLELYGVSQPGDCICPNGQTCAPERANETAQTGKCNREHVKTHVETSMDTPYSPPAPPGDGAAKSRKPRRGSQPKDAPDWKPERFAGFWSFYPRGEAKQAAIRAWDKLRPPDELIDEMAAALQRQMESESWRAGVGIPYASTWLNNRRWTDQLKDTYAAAPPQPLRGKGVEYL